MPWNPSPEMAVARDAAKKLGNADECIIVYINYRTEKLGVASYGRTRALCTHAKMLADAVYDCVQTEMEKEV